MPSTLATGNPPVTGDTPGDPGRGGGRGGRGGGWGNHGHWRNKSKRGNLAAQPTERNAGQQNLGGDGQEHTQVSSNNNNRGRGGAPNWSTRATAGRGRGRGGYQGGRGGGNGNFGHLPPPPGIPNRWQALEPSPAPDDQNGEGQDVGEQGASSGNGNGVQGWHSGDGGRDSGRGWFGRGRSSPSFRGRGSSPMPPPDDTHVRNWVEFQARGRGSNIPSGGGSRPGTPGEHRGRGRGGYDRGRGNWDGGRGGWDGGRGRGDRGRGAGDRGRGDWGRGRGHSERGRGRGQGGGRGEYNNTNGRWNAFNNTRNPPPVLEELPPPRDIMEGVLVPALEQLAPPAIEISDKPISLKDFKCIGSYTWLQDRDPVIVVPGAPRQWQDRPLPIQVRFDRGIRMLDENAYHMGSASSLIPVFRAVDAFDQVGGEDGARITDAFVQAEEGPEPINWHDVDFVTDRNNLRKFARWIRASLLNQTSPAAATDSDSLAVSPAGENGPDEAGPTPPPDHTSPAPTSTTLPEAEWDTRQDFRIDLRLGGEQTVLMERWAVCAREHVAPPKGGCRDNFVREATANAPECENGGGHYRIVQYDLDGLKMVVRWEVDTRAPNFAASSSSPNTSSDSGSGQLPSVPATPVDIEELARWDDTPTSGAAAWGAPETAGSASVDIDELAKWDDNTVDQAAAWGALPVPTDTTSATSPIEQDSHKNNDKNNDFDAFAIWETPEDDPAAAAAAWGAPPPQPFKSAASAWGPPPSEGGAAHGAPTSTGGINKPGPPQELKVIRAGRLLPQSAVTELATRSAQYVDRTSNEDTFLQMFLTQTPFNLVAVHTRGSFDRVIRQELDAPEFAKFNEDADMMHTVQQLVALLRQVQELVKEYGKGAKLSLVCEKGTLALYSRGEEDEDRLLASELARFEG